MRFRRVPAALRARVLASDEAALDRIAERVLTAPTIDDLF